MENKELLTADLTDIVFEHRNRLYGAYEIRKGYNVAVQKSMLSSVVLLGCFVLLVSFTQPPPPCHCPCKKDNGIVTVVNLNNYNNTPSNTKPKRAKPTALPPKPVPAVSKPTVAYTVPIVVADEMVKNTKPMPEQQDFAKAEAGTKTQTGDVNAIAATSGNGTDIKAVVVDTTEANSAEKTKTTTSIVTEDVFVSVEESPQFGNGEKDLFKYLSKNIKYPASALDMGIEGKVFVQFVVEKDGSISNAKVVRGPEFGGLKEEAVRVVSGMPKWKAGRQNGVNVRVRYTLPIAFKLAQ
jgi:protein TonB